MPRRGEGEALREPMVVTDVAEMGSGTVCIAGYIMDGLRPVRPVLPLGGGLPWELLRDRLGSVVEPFAEIEIDLGERCPDLPHREDRLILGTGEIEVRRVFPERVYQRLLRLTAQDVVADLFGTEVFEQRFVRPGDGHASLATVQIAQIDDLNLDPDPQYGRDHYRLTFRDAQWVQYRLRATDVAFREFCRQMIQRHGGRRRAAAEIKRRLNRADELYLRIGLSRPFTPRDDTEPRCYLIVTGVYSLPTYLDDRWSAYYPPATAEAERR